MRVAVVGSVRSTEVLIRQLLKHGFNECAVWGYEPSDASLVSKWCALRAICNENGLRFEPFRKVQECEVSLRDFAPDILFVVGLSQLVPASMLDIAWLGNVGFHPTALPKGRGRAPIAWLILERMDGAASFFLLGDGADDGPILVQEPFSVCPDDDAASVEAKVLAAEARALDTWLPTLRDKGLVAKAQDHSEATWFGRRAPEDGWLNWSAPRESLLRLIRAAAPPHPGAYTFFRDDRIEILSAEISDRQETGVTGRIVSVDRASCFEVQCGDALLLVQTWRCETGWQPRVGMLLGYYEEAEIFQLRNKVTMLEARLEALEHRLIERGGDR